MKEFRFITSFAEAKSRRQTSFYGIYYDVKDILCHPKCSVYQTDLYCVRFLIEERKKMDGRIAFFAQLLAEQNFEYWRTTVFVCSPTPPEKRIRLALRNFWKHKISFTKQKWCQLRKRQKLKFILLRISNIKSVRNSFEYSFWSLMRRASNSHSGNW